MENSKKTPKVVLVIGKLTAKTLLNYIQQSTQSLIPMHRRGRGPLFMHTYNYIANSHGGWNGMYNNDFVRLGRHILLRTPSPALCINDTGYYSAQTDSLVNRHG